MADLKKEPTKERIKLGCQFGPHTLTELGPYQGSGYHITMRSSMDPPTWGIQTRHFSVEFTAAGDVDIGCSDGKERSG